METYKVELTGAEAFMLFSIVNQTIKEMEEQGRSESVPGKYKTLLEAKGKIRKCLEAWRNNDDK